MVRILALFFLLFSSLAACSSGGTVLQSPEDTSDLAPADDETSPQHDARAELPGDSSAPDLSSEGRSQPDTSTPLPYRFELEAGAEALAGSTVHLELAEVEEASFAVMAVGQGLGKVAGLAFTLQYPQDLVRLVGVQSVVDLGTGGSTETRWLTRELGPGRLAFGVARFCLAKMPWGKTDQCGGETLDDPVPLVRFTFEALGTGRIPLSFHPTSTLIRRPDRSAVAAQWIGASVQVGR